MVKIAWCAPTRVEITLETEELAAFGLKAERLSLCTGAGRTLLHRIFSLIGQMCGLRRDGKYTLVRCRPYRDGGCRLSVEFTDYPSARAYCFDGGDDLLDAVNQLGRTRVFDLWGAEITAEEDRLLLYIPSGAVCGAHEAALLSEYAI